MIEEAKTSQHEVAAKLRKYSVVEGVAMITGASDIILKVRVGSIEELDKFVTVELRNIHGIEKTQTASY